MQFLAYGKAKALVAGGAERAHSLSVEQSFAAGALTGFAVAFVEAPIDLLKTQLQTQVFQAQPRFTTLTQAVALIVGQHGLRGVYQGLGATVLRNVPAVSLYFGVYESVRRALAQRSGRRVDQLGTGEVLLAGAVGGFAYWSVYPLDVVKSAMMADAIERPQRRFPTMLQATRTLYAEGGVRRFFTGLSPCLLRAAPANAVCFALYEKSLQLMDSWV